MLQVIDLMQDHNNEFRVAESKQMPYEKECIETQHEYEYWKDAMKNKY